MEAWIGLASAFIVGMLGLIGILINQHYERQKEKRILYRAKIEELAFKTITFSTQVKKYHASIFQNKTGQSYDITDLTKLGGEIEILVTLYFPDLLSECEIFIQCSLDYVVAQRSHEIANDSIKDTRWHKLVVKEKDFDEIHDHFFQKIKLIAQDTNNP